MQRITVFHIYFRLNDFAGGNPGKKTNDMKTINNVDDLSDDLCLYCPLDDDEKGTHGVPNGYISCEGRCCQEAYEMYIEEWTE